MSAVTVQPDTARDRAWIGSNVCTVGGIDKAFIQAAEWDCRSVQIYSTPSRRWEVPDLDPAVREAFLDGLDASGVRAVVAHVPFLVNLATPDPDALLRSVTRLITEIRRASELRIDSVILHPGAGGTSNRDDALRQAAAGLRTAVAATDDLSVNVLVENMAGQGTALCGSFDELARLLDEANAGPRLGVCLDTAHAFIAGYPVTGYAGYNRLVQALDDAVGLDRVLAVHLNDALTAQGSGHDRHAAPGEGQMGPAVFHAFMRDERFADRPAVLEVPNRDGGSQRALELLRRLALHEEALPEQERYARDVATQLGLFEALR